MDDAADLLEAAVSARCVGVSDEGRIEPSTTLPSRSDTTTVWSASTCAHGIPLRLDHQHPTSAVDPADVPEGECDQPGGRETAIGCGHLFAQLGK